MDRVAPSGVEIGAPMLELATPLTPWVRWLETVEDSGWILELPTRLGLRFPTNNGELKIAAKLVRAPTDRSVRVEAHFSELQRERAH